MAPAGVELKSNHFANKTGEDGSGVVPVTSPLLSPVTNKHCGVIASPVLSRVNAHSSANRA